ncbi:MAG: amidase [Paracoccaceae bacterium]|nr:MAG: amidase [Paracoccaceae bacterium]
MAHPARSRRTAPEAILGLSAVELRDRIAAGALKAETVVEACLARIAEVEPQVGAWAWLDGDLAVAQARALDARRQSGAALGPLHGLPVGLKDIIDTRGIPTCNGTAIDAGRVPAQDAWVVARMRAAGAVILGKTVTTECAFMHPGKTVNPWNHAHTPGGSSQGSAAAVAAGMVPLAIGTQTGGSVIRPASFCGVVGLKPSFGLIPRTGVLMQSPFLDTLGIFARDAADAALLADVLAGHDPADRATELLPMPRILDTLRAGAPVRPMFARLRLPAEAEAHPDMVAAMDELAAALGDQCFDVPVPGLFAEAEAQRRRINFAEMAKCYYALERRGRDRMSTLLTDAIDEGKSVLARDYLAALDWRDLLGGALAEIFSRCDAILCPAAPGPAPQGLGSTGSAIMNGVWTLAGTPAVTLPLFQSADGLPMGVQVVGRRGDDARLMRTAGWLADWAGKMSKGEGT